MINQRMTRTVSIILISRYRILKKLLSFSWEPKESFEGSEHFIERFWKRCHPDRDIDDPTAWSKGEEVLPVGPPRMRVSSVF
jgi:hypothetical protein